MEKTTLFDIQLNKICVIDSISLDLPQKVIKRLSTLGIIKNARVVVLKRSRFSASGIVYVLGSKVCLDKNILARVFVRTL